MDAFEQAFSRTHLERDEQPTRLADEGETKR